MTSQPRTPLSRSSDPGPRRTPRVFILDPDLQSTIGHNYEASVRTAFSARKAGYEPLIFGNRHLSHADLDVGDGLKIRPYFNAHAFDFAGLEGRRVRARLSPLDRLNRFEWEDYLDRLWRLHERHAIQADDILYVHTLSHPVAQAIHTYLAALPPAARPRLYALIYCAPDKVQGTPVGDVGVLELLAAYERSGLLGRWAFFHAETRGIAEAYAVEGFDFPVFMGPIPQESYTPDRHRADPITISYLGEARREKGFELAPDILAELKRMIGAPAFESLRFVVQISSNRGNDTDSVQAARERLRRMAEDSPNLQLIDEMTTEEYRRRLTETDIALLPYDPKDYAVRGSGVAYECLAGGRAVVCSPDLDIIGTFEGENVAAAEAFSAAELAKTLAGVLLHGRFSREGVLRQTDGLDRFSVDRFFSELLIEQAQRHPSAGEPTPEARPRCLYIGQAAFSGGNGFVQRCHLDALTKLGYDIVFLGVPWVLQGSRDYDDAKARCLSVLYDRAHDFRIIQTLFAEVVFDQDFQNFFDTAFHKKFEFFTNRTYDEIFDQSVHIPEFRAWQLSLSDFDFVLHNYIFTAPLIERVAGADTPKIVEVHDFQAQQNVFRRQERDKDDPLAVEDPHWFEGDARFEFNAARRFDRLLHISPELAQTFEEAGVTTGRVARPYALIDDATDPGEALEGVSLFEFLEANCERAAFEKILPALSTQMPDRIDLLFYGTNHPSNTVSLTAFIEDVFAPELARDGVKLFVAGSICDAIEETGVIARLGLHRNVFLLGRVKDLRALTHAARVVALYVTQGTGFPTKVIETLGEGQAFVCNARALADLAEATDAYFPAPSDPRTVAEDARRLLADPEARRARGANGRAFYEKHFSVAQYLKTLAEVTGLQGALPEIEARAPLHGEHSFALPEDLDEYFHTVGLGEPIAFSAHGVPARFLFGDWSDPEIGHTWLDGRMGGLCCRLTAPPEGTVQATVKVLMLPNAVERDPSFRIRVNGVEVYRGRCGGGVEDHLFAIPPHVFGENGICIVEFEAAATGRVPGDARDLSLNFQTLRFARADATFDADPEVEAVEPAPEPVGDAAARNPFATEDGLDDEIADPHPVAATAFDGSDGPGAAEPFGTLDEAFATIGFDEDAWTGDAADEERDVGEAQTAMTERMDDAAREPERPEAPRRDPSEETPVVAKRSGPTLGGRRARAPRKLPERGTTIAEWGPLRPPSHPPRVRMGAAIDAAFGADVDLSDSSGSAEATHVDDGVAEDAQAAHAQGETTQLEPTRRERGRSDAPETPHPIAAARAVGRGPSFSARRSERSFGDGRRAWTGVVRAAAAARATAQLDDPTAAPLEDDAPSPRTGRRAPLRQLIDYKGLLGRSDDQADAELSLAEDRQPQEDGARENRQNETGQRRRSVFRKGRAFSA